MERLHLLRIARADPSYLWAQYSIYVQFCVKSLFRFLVTKGLLSL